MGKDPKVNKLLTPDLDPVPDHLRGGPSHGYTLVYKNQVNRSNSF